MAERTAGGGRLARAVGRLWQPKPSWSALSTYARRRVVQRVGTVAAAGLVVPTLLALAVGFSYLGVQLIDAFGAIRDLDYGALEDETLVVVFRNLLWGVSAAAGAAVAVVGVGLAAWRTVTQHRQSRIEQRRVETETFSKAMELLGNDVFAIRLGGILQLETLARQSQRLHWPIKEAFCAYLREKRSVHAAREKVNASDPETSFPADLQAILTAIGRRKRRHDPANTPLPLAGVDLQGANLRRARLQGASLYSANLRGANLFQAHLEAADLGHASLADANLCNAHLQGADLRHSDVTQEQIDDAYGDEKLE